MPQPASCIPTAFHPSAAWCRSHPLRLVLALTTVFAIGTLGAGEALQWDKGDPEIDHVEGTSTAKAYARLKLKAPAQLVIVAVVDSGVDIAHEDLKERIWVNAKEKSGRSGTDDDQNGHVDDVTGWNFLGSKDGKRQVENGRLEVTREYARLLSAKGSGTLPAADEPYLAKVEQLYNRKRRKTLQEFISAASMQLQYDQMVNDLRKLGLVEKTPEAITAFVQTNPKARGMGARLGQMAAQGATAEKLEQGVREMATAVVHHFNLDFKESAAIGDDPRKPDETGYGNGNVAVATAMHGTHVAGIIAAQRDNKLGIDGQCEWARILPVVVVPNGDERDKDVANGIRYAVDNGAKIINCSFGKDLSPDKTTVEAAMRYAETKGVLIVHAAGNDSADIDAVENYPSPVARTGGRPHRYANWIEVGASTRSKGPDLVAEFSNFGRDSVDLFAPGDGIRSTVPGNGYADEQGTSMAAPEVAGIAALVWSQYPRLTAVEVRTVLLVTARRYPDLQVKKPQTNELVRLDDLCLTGGLVDAFAALTYLETNQGKVRAADLTRIQELTARAEAPRKPKPAAGLPLPPNRPAAGRDGGNPETPTP